MIIESAELSDIPNEEISSNGDRTVIIKYYRDELGEEERNVEIVNDFSPRIYVPADLNFESFKEKKLEDVYNRPSHSQPNWVGRPVKDYLPNNSLKETKTAYDDNEVQKLEIRTTEVIPAIREALEEFYDGQSDPHYEADVSFTNRYMIDTTDGQMKEYPRRTQYMDIEVSDKGGMPDIDTGDSEILSIACYDNATDEYYVFTHKPEIKSKVNQEFPDYRVEVFSNERDMLGAYLSDIEEKDFSIISGYNLNRFDFKYLCARMDRLQGDSKEKDERVDYQRLSPLENGVWVKDDYVTIKGREIFDLYKAYRTLKWGEQESYKLGDVAKREIDRDKISMDMGFYELYDEDFKRFLDYNKRDVELTVELDESMEIQQFWDEVARICKTGLEEVLISMRQVDNYILDYTNGQTVLPSKSTDTEQGDEATGGAVFDAPEGVLEDVAVLDLACLTKDHLVLVSDKSDDDLTLAAEDIRDIEKGDKVFSMDSEGELIEDKVVDTVEKQHTGELYHLKTDDIDQKMTPEHRLYVKEEGKKPRYVQVQNLELGTEYTIPNLHGEFTDSFVPSEDIEKKDVSKKVYCLKMEETSNFIAGRNGNFNVTGNSLYPNLIQQFNISPETIEKEEGQIDIPDSDVGITTDKEGILPQVFGELFDKRGEYKDKMKQAKTGSREEELYDMRQGAVKIVMNCFSPSTRILTPGGKTKLVSELEEGEKVSTINPETGEKEPKEVESINKQFNEFEELIVFSVNRSYKGCDLEVTPNHRMVVKEENSSDIEIIEAEDLMERLEDGEIYYVPLHKSTGEQDNDFVWFPLQEKNVYKKNDQDGHVYGPTVEDNRTVIATSNGGRLMMGTGNTIYGVSLNPYFRLYNYDVGRSITKMGRETIKWSSEIADEEGFDSVYGDSVAEYEPVVVRIDGNPQCLKIEDFYDIWEDSSDRDMEVWSDTGWTDVQDVIRKEAGESRNLVRVNTDRSVVTVTKEHSLLDEDGSVVSAEDLLWDDRLLHREIDVEMAKTDDRFENENSDTGWILGVLFNGTNIISGEDRISVRITTIGNENANRCKQILQHEFGIKNVFKTDMESVNGKYSIKVEQQGSKPSGNFRKFLKLVKKHFHDSDKKDIIPDMVWNGSEEFQRGFIDGYMGTGKGEGTGKRLRLDKVQKVKILSQKCDYPMEIKRLGSTGAKLVPSEEELEDNSVDEIVEFTANRKNAINMDYVYDISTESEHFQAGVGDMIVHNTDSIFVQKRDGNPTMKEINDLAEKIDDSYREFVREVGVPDDRDMFLEMEFEKFYKRLFFAGVKKRYSGLKTVEDSEESVWLKREDGKEARVSLEKEIELKSGKKKAKDINEGDIYGDKEIVEVETLPVGDLDKEKVGITGFETVRSDNSQFARDLQREVLEMIVRGKDEDDILDYAHQKKKEVKEGEADINKIAIPKGIGKDPDNYAQKPPHVRGAIYANRYFGTDFGEADKAKMVYVQYTGEYPNTDVICFDEPSDIPDDIVIDWNKMAEKCVNGVVDQIFHAMGWEISGLDGQSDIGDVL